MNARTPEAGAAAAEGGRSKMGRNRRGNRPASMKARLAIASAVLVGGGAIGAVAVATSHNSSPTTDAASAGYSQNWGYQRNLNYGQALSTALGEWGRSPQSSFTTLARMSPLTSFATQWRGHSMFAAQRGVVLITTKHWFLVRSFNGKLELWFFSGNTQFANVSNSAVGTSAMTGNTLATVAAMGSNNLVPATQAMAGTSNLSTFTTPVAKPTTVTVTVNGNANVTVQVTITSTTATVAPMTTTAAIMTQTSMTRPTTVPIFATWNHLKRGDLVLVAGVKSHNLLFAHLVLFTPPVTTVTPTPTATATLPTTAPTGVVPTATSTATFSGQKS
jgi:hypothetical protein